MDVRFRGDFEYLVYFFGHCLILEIFFSGVVGVIAEQVFQNPGDIAQ